MDECITCQDAQYALDLVQRICTEVGPGIPGSPQERARAAIFQQELESQLGAENVRVEEFSFSPRAFLSPYPSLPCMLISVLLNIFYGRILGVAPWLIASLALVLAIMPALLFVFEFILGLELVDPLFKQQKSINVVGKLSQSPKDVKRCFILSGHHDSAPENTWLRFTGYGFYFLSATYCLGLVTLLIMNSLLLTGTILRNDSIVHQATVGWALLAYPIIPAMIYVLFTTRGWKDGGNVPGAADNLSGSALMVAMCRCLAKNPDCIPPDTEIRFISFGSEEAGLRGSRRYVERHLAEFKTLDVRLLNFETVAHPEITILSSDMNGAVKNCTEMVKSVVAAAQRARVPYKVTSASLGVATDAAPFSRAGLKATTLLPFRVPQQMIAFYHTSRDRPEVLSMEPFMNVLRLALEWIRCGGE